MPTSHKRLYRSNTNRIIAGVCGGMGEYFGIDPTWIRVLFIVLLLAAGLTLVMYLILWLIVPPEPPQSQAEFTTSAPNQSSDDASRAPGPQQQ